MLENMLQSMQSMKIQRSNAGFRKRLQNSSTAEQNCILNHDEWEIPPIDSTQTAVKVAIATKGRNL